MCIKGLIFAPLACFIDFYQIVHSDERYDLDAALFFRVRFPANGFDPASQIASPSRVHNVVLMQDPDADGMAPVPRVFHSRLLASALHPGALSLGRGVGARCLSCWCDARARTPLVRFASCALRTDRIHAVTKRVAYYCLRCAKPAYL